MTSFAVSPVEPEEAWDAIVETSGGLVFASASYLRLIQSQLPSAAGAHLGAFRDDELVGVMPSFICCSETFGCVNNSSPYYGSHGGAYTRLVGDERSDCVDALLRAYRAACSRSCVLSNVVEPLGSQDRRLYEKVLQPWCSDERVGQIFEDLEPSEAGMLARYHSKTRNMVRKARREGLTVSTSTRRESLEFVSRTHSENMAVIGGKAKARSFFWTLGDHLEAGRSWVVYEALLDGECIAALLVLFFGDSAEYFTPVTRQEHRSRQPMSLLVHTAMLDAATRGLRRFNFGGTWRSQQGVYRFKSRWGASDISYRYFISRYGDDDSLFRMPAADLLDTFDGFYLYPLPDEGLVSGAAAGTTLRGRGR